MVFYPGAWLMGMGVSPSHSLTSSVADNEKRATRLQQLVDSMANMQTDIKHDADVMDKKNVTIRPKIDALLKQNGIDSIDDLIAKATAQMTPEERKQWEAVSSVLSPSNLRIKMLTHMSSSSRRRRRARRATTGRTLPRASLWFPKALC